MSTSEQAALVHGVSFPVCGLGCPCSTARGAQGGTLQGQGPAGFGCTVFGCSAFTPLPSPQKHPDFPKKPLTPYFRFFMEKRAKYAKLHPEMSNLDLTKILSKKYKELPEKKKVGLGDPAGSLCHVCLPGTPALPVQPAEPSSCLAQVSPGCWFRPVGPVRLPALLPRTAGWGWRFCPSVRPFQTMLGGGFAVGWDVLGLTRSSLPVPAGCAGAGTVTSGQFVTGSRGPGCKVLRVARPHPAPCQGCPWDGTGDRGGFLALGLETCIWEQSWAWSPLGLTGISMPAPSADIPLCLLVVPR